jgi:hypothetical protein
MPHQVRAEITYLVDALVAGHDAAANTNINLTVLTMDSSTLSLSVFAFTTICTVKLLV